MVGRTHIEKRRMNKAVTRNREFVLYRNDRGIPPEREIRRIDTELRIREGYPKVSIIIPTSDGYRNGLFPALLKQLSEQSFQDFETIIVKGDPRQGRAINTGADIARGQYLLTLDDDTSLVSKDAFEKLARIMENDVSIGMAGGINVIPEDAPFFIRRAMREIPRRTTPPVEEVTDSDLAEHPLLLMRKGVFLRIGGENELIPRGLDPYLRQEFRKAGYRVVVVPGVTYSHLPPATLFKLIKQFYRNGKQAAFCSKFYPQWVIETPAKHGGGFQENASFTLRLFRYPIRMLKAAIQSKWILLLTQICYAAGFARGYAGFKGKDP
jgi:GT2 family glycosyltransferase